MVNKKSLFFALTLSAVSLSTAALAADKDDGDQNYLFHQQAVVNKTAFKNEPQRITSDFTPKIAGGQPEALAAHADKPVMVIRFNQPRVNYEMQLYSILQKALDIKPEAKFEVVSLIPSIGSEAIDYENKVVASENGKQFLKTVDDIGLPRERIDLNYQGSTEVSSNELRVFIR